MGTSGSKTNVEELPAIGKIVCIIGANTGIGFATAKGVCRKSPEHLIITGRNESRILAAYQELHKLHPTVSISYAVVDLSSFTSMDKFVQSLSVERIDILVDNAGVFMPPFLRTEQGFEVTLGTNVIGTAYVTRKLEPLILKSNNPRIIVLSSRMALMISSTSIFEKYLLDIGGERVTASTMEVYAASKFFNSCYAFELQNYFKKLGHDSIRVVSVDPGFVYTDIMNKTDKNSLMANFNTTMATCFAKSCEDGAVPVLFCICSDEVDANPGGMFGEGPCVKVQPLPETTFTPDNCARVFSAIERVIAAKAAV